MRRRVKGLFGVLLQDYSEAMGTHTGTEYKLAGAYQITVNIPEATTDCYGLHKIASYPVPISIPTPSRAEVRMEIGTGYKAICKPPLHYIPHQRRESPSAQTSQQTDTHPFLEALIALILHAVGTLCWGGREDMLTNH